MLPPSQTPTPTPRPAVPIWAIVSVAWCGPALLAVFDSIMQARLANRAPAGWRVLAWQGGDWLICGALTPIIFQIARRYPLRRDVLPRNLGVHLAASILFCAAWSGSGMALRALLLIGPDAGVTTGDMASWFLTTLPFGVAVYFGVLGVEHATFYFFETRAHAAQMATLLAQLAEARWGALQMQLQPHFLFNSLNAIGVLVRGGDTAAASRMIELLGDMLREILGAGAQPERTLASELAFAERYLAIEQVRFSDRLRPRIDVESTLYGAAVPSFVLQPLVENAIRHGIAKRTEAGVVHIAARRDGADLVLLVEDDGPGVSPSAVQTTGGVGLANTRARLTTLYGARGSITLERRPSGGSVATVRLPYRMLDTGAPEADR